MHKTLTVKNAAIRIRHMIIRTGIIEQLTILSLRPQESFVYVFKIFL